MLAFSPTVRVFVATRPVDMRLGYDGLFGLVQGVLGESPFTGHWFVFFNRHVNRVKILAWDGNGLALYSKRLERGQFRLPFDQTNGRVELKPTELMLILEGIDPTSVRWLPRWTPHHKNMTFA